MSKILNLAHRANPTAAGGSPALQKITIRSIQFNFYHVNHVIMSKILNLAHRANATVAGGIPRPTALKEE